MARTLEGLEALGLYMQASGKNQEPEISHFFGDDIYVRSTKLAGGSFFIGRIQKKRHVMIMSYGHMTLWDTSFGFKEAFGFNVFETNAGVRRAAYVHEDTQFLCAYHVPNALHEDREALIDVVTFKCYEEYVERNQNGRLLGSGR